MAEALAAKVQAAEEAAATSSGAAVESLREVVVGPHPNDAECLKVKEAALQKLTDLLVKQGSAPALRNLLTQLRPLFAAIPKAKTAKIVRTIVDSIAKVPNSNELLVSGMGMLGREAKKREVSRQPATLSAASARQLHMDSLFHDVASCCWESVPPSGALIGPCTLSSLSPAAGGVQGAGGMGQLGEAHLSAAAH